MLAKLLCNLCIHDDIERRTTDVLVVGHGGSITIQIGHTTVSIELGREVELPSAWCIRHGDQAFVTVNKRLFHQAIVDGHLHIVVAESQGQVKVLENLTVGLDLGTVGIRLPIEVIDADFMGIGITVEDDLVDKVGAIEVGLKGEFAPTEAESLA